MTCRASVKNPEAEIGAYFGLGGFGLTVRCAGLRAQVLIVSVAGGNFYEHLHRWGPKTRAWKGTERVVCLVPVHPFDISFCPWCMCWRHCR